MRRKRIGLMIFLLLVGLGVLLLVGLLLFSFLSKPDQRLSLISKPPEVTVLEPADGTIIRSGQGVVIIATVRSSLGIQRVDLLVDGRIEQNHFPDGQGDEQIQVAFPWFGSQSGAHDFHVVAYDLSGQANSSSPRRIGVWADSDDSVEAGQPGDDGGGVPDSGEDESGPDGAGEQQPPGGQDQAPGAESPPEGEAVDPAAEQGAVPDLEPLPLPPQPEDESPVITSFEAESQRVNEALTAWLRIAAGDDLGLDRLEVFAQGPEGGGEMQRVACDGERRCEYQVDVPVAVGTWWFTARAFDNSGHASEPVVQVLEFIGEADQPLAVAFQGWQAGAWAEHLFPDGAVVAAALVDGDLGDLFVGLPPGIFFQADRGPILDGFVLDADGAPISGVEVTLFWQDLSRQFRRTDEEGYYSFEHLDPGVYTLVPAKRGYSFRPYSHTFQLEDLRKSVLFSGQRVTYTLSGTILDRENRPLTNKRVLIERCLPPLQSEGASPVERCPTTRSLTEANTGATGHWSKDELPNGIYLVRPFDAGIEFLPAYYYAEIEGQDEWIDFQAQGETPEADLTFSISGRIQSECPSEKGTFGRTEWHWFPPGFYERAGADCSPGITERSSWFGAGEARVRLYACAADSAFQYGGVHPEHGQACVGPANQDRRSQVAETDGDGRFSFEGLRPGTYELRPISFGLPGYFAWDTGRALAYAPSNAYIKLSNRDVFMVFKSKLTGQWQCGYDIYRSGVEEVFDACAPSPLP